MAPDRPPHRNVTIDGPDRSPTAPGPSVNGFAVASLVLGISWLMWLG